MLQQCQPLPLCYIVCYDFFIKVDSGEKKAKQAEIITGVSQGK